MAMVVGPEGLYFTLADEAGAAGVADSGLGVISRNCNSPDRLCNLREKGCYLFF
jgi:hypothetical protein